MGGVNHNPDTDRSDSIWGVTEDELEELTDEEGVYDEDDEQRLQLYVEHELRLLKQLTSLTPRWNLSGCKTSRLKATR